MLIPGTQIKAWSELQAPRYCGLPALGWNTDVIHVTEAGCVQEPLRNFSQGNIEVVRCPATEAEQSVILQRAYGSIGRYVWSASSNCGHYANWAFTGVEYSEQWQRVGLGVAACAFFWFLKSDSSRP